MAKHATPGSYNKNNPSDKMPLVTDHGAHFKAGHEYARGTNAAGVPMADMGARSKSHTDAREAAFNKKLDKKNANGSYG